MTEVHLFLRETNAAADKANSKKARHSRDHAAKYIGLDYQLEIDPKQFKVNIKQLITLDQTRDYSYYPIIDDQYVQNSHIVLPQLMNNARSEYQQLLNQVEGGDN